MNKDKQTIKSLVFNKLQESAHTSESLTGLTRELFYNEVKDLACRATLPIRYSTVDRNIRRYFKEHRTRVSTTINSL